MNSAPPGFRRFKCGKCGGVVYLEDRHASPPEWEPWSYQEGRPLCPFHPGMTYFLYDGTASDDG